MGKINGIIINTSSFLDTPFHIFFMDVAYCISNDKLPRSIAIHKSYKLGNNRIFWWSYKASVACFFVVVVFVIFFFCTEKNRTGGGGGGGVLIRDSIYKKKYHMYKKF